VALLPPGWRTAAAADALDAGAVPEAVEAQAHRHRTDVACCRRQHWVQNRRRRLAVARGLLRRRLVRREADGQVEVDVQLAPRGGGPRLVVAAVAARLRRVGRRDPGGEAVVLGVAWRRRGEARRRQLLLRRGGGGTVRLRVDAAGEELALDVRVPVVLYLVVRPARQPPGDQRPPEKRAKWSGKKSAVGSGRRPGLLVAEQVVELDDELVLLLGEVAALEVRAEVVDPAQAAALAAPEQACAAVVVGPYVSTSSLSISLVHVYKSRT
jgi:hypothetical protein